LFWKVSDEKILAGEGAVAFFVGAFGGSFDKEVEMTAENAEKRVLTTDGTDLQGWEKRKFNRGIRNTRKGGYDRRMEWRRLTKKGTDFRCLERSD